jgi:hypothetical protein
MSATNVFKRAKLQLMTMNIQETFNIKICRKYPKSSESGSFQFSFDNS